MIIVCLCGVLFYFIWSFCLFSSFCWKPDVRYWSKIFFFMLGDKHAFPSLRSLVWGFVFISSGIRMGLNFAVAMVTIIPLEASNSCTDSSCLWCGIIFQRVFLLPLACSHCLWDPQLVSGCSPWLAPQRGSVSCSSPTCVPPLFYSPFLVWDGAQGTRKFSHVLIEPHAQAGPVTLGLSLVPAPSLHIFLSPSQDGASPTLSSPLPC